MPIYTQAIKQAKTRLKYYHKMEQKELKLDDFSEFLKEHLTYSDITKMSVNLECSITTIYNYLNDKIANKFMGKAILDAGMKIISEKGIKTPITIK